MASDNSVVEVVLGAQWGDEGKGKLVDLLATTCNMICRCQGGNNAGHTVVVNGNTYDFHLLPSGIVNESAIAVIGNGVVIHLPGLFSEIDSNIKKGLHWIEHNLRVSDRAHIVFDLHQLIDGLEEQNRGQSGGKVIGTTKRGIGPTYSSKATRNGLRICDLVGDWKDFSEKYRRLVAYFQKRYPEAEVDVEADLKKLEGYRDRLKPMVCDTTVLLYEAINKKSNRIVVEGAQSCLLDIDFGTYPCVTSSNCCVGGVCTGLGIPPTKIGAVYGVFKAYTTRVGDGAFPTELKDKMGEYLQNKGHEFGVTTGRGRRCGWLDMITLCYANMVNGFTAMALTKLDCLDDLDEIKVAHKYESPDGTEVTSFPANMSELDQIKVHYLSFPGWKTSTTNCRNFSDLPAKAQDYVRAVQKALGVPIRWIGVGKSRDHVINVPDQVWKI